MSFAARGVASQQPASRRSGMARCAAARVGQPGLCGDCTMQVTIAVSVAAPGVALQQPVSRRSGRMARCTTASSSAAASACARPLGRPAFAPPSPARRRMTISKPCPAPHSRASPPTPHPALLGACQHTSAARPTASIQLQLSSGESPRPQLPAGQLGCSNKWCGSLIWQPAAHPGRSGLQLLRKRRIQYARPTEHTPVNSVYAIQRQPERRVGFVTWQPAAHPGCSGLQLLRELRIQKTAPQRRSRPAGTGRRPRERLAWLSLQR